MPVVMILCEPADAVLLAEDVSFDFAAPALGDQPAEDGGGRDECLCIARDARGRRGRRHCDGDHDGEHCRGAERRDREAAWVRAGLGDR